MREKRFVIHESSVEEYVESLENKNTQGTAISGGHISISINTLTTSLTIQSESCITETERRWKRIRIEESDSDKQP